MDRRDFVRLLAATPLLTQVKEQQQPPAADIPKLKIVTNYKPEGHLGMPGPYPGKVVKVASAKCVDETTNAANADVVR